MPPKAKMPPESSTSPAEMSSAHPQVKRAKRPLVSDTSEKDAPSPEPELTTTACFVGGWCAVSLYHGISEKSKNVAWDIDAAENFMKRKKAPACVAKYVERRFEVVSYERKMVGLDEPEVGGMDGKLPWKPRTISDLGCLVADFEPYLRDPDSRTTAMQKAAMTESLNIRWAEGIKTSKAITIVEVEKDKFKSEKVGDFSAVEIGGAGVVS
ncbi:uncharacterized protein PAC_02077 [Phialocephala subalpina]|uniref:Uncharacterized protein n=1 Tax=Phialocephala subalpina TaxID=576137 RepID=A0A1L7WHF3_9HELO|nr:uncharacterized protein PAC_02077 [Phialocephala subalpina]